MAKTCRLCGHAVPKGRRRYCSAACSLDAAKLTQRAWRDRNASKGLCAICAKSPPEKNRRFCRPCLDGWKVYRDDAIADRESKGLCPRCGQPRDGRWVYCALCRDYQRAYRAGMRERTGESWREYVNRLNHERRARRAKG